MSNTNSFDLTNTNSFDSKKTNSFDLENINSFDLENTKEFQFHELADIFPMIEGPDFETLVNNIKEEGLLEPIYIYENKIIDGRNRYLACQKAGIEPRFEEYKGNDPLKFIISKNLHRRHLSESQRAAIGAKISKIPSGVRADILRNHKNEGSPIGEPFITEVEAAKLLNVSPRTIQRVKAVEREKPELIEPIVKGEMTAYEAEKLIKKQKREEERSKIAEKGATIKPADKWNIYHGDIATIELNKQYDFIITDPPYPKEYLPLYETLAKRATEWLKDDGLAVIMCGQSYLNQIYKILDNYLVYYWTGCYMLPKQPTPLRQRQVNTSWKPILIYAKGEKYKGKIFGDVFVSETPDKEYHDWGQSVSGMLSIITQMCLPGQTILDPFCGSGSTGVAALQHGCFFDGIDIDIEAVNVAKGRLASYNGSYISDKATG